MPSHPLISELPGSLPPSLWLLAQQGEVRRYRKDTLLIQERDLGDTLYIVLSGRLRAFSASECGKEMTYGTYGPGDYFGELCLDGGLRVASVVTLESCSCVVITRQRLLQHLLAHPDFCFEMLENSLANIRTLTTQVRQLALDDVYGRLRSLLDAQPTAPTTGATPPAGASSVRSWQRMTHKEISQRIGCSREMVSRLLKDLENGGFIRRHAAGIEILRRLPARW
jgi:CRP/FNR family cyclic AMP-dependent transcriptional regulator